MIDDALLIANFLKIKNYAKCPYLIVQPLLSCYKKLCFLLLSLFLIGCGSPKSAEAVFDNYLDRLSNSLDADREDDLTASVLMRYPLNRELMQTTAPTKINLLDFLRLSTCDLQRHIGQRNSSLGLFLEPSQRLIYEYKFIDLGDVCLQTLEVDSELYNLLKESLTIKREQLAIVRWNAVFASDEFSVLFSLSTKPLNVEEVILEPNELYAALDDIYRYTNAKVMSSEDEFALEQAFSVVVSSKRIGQIRHSLQLSSLFLAGADRLLASRLSTRPLCFNERPNQKSDIVQTVFLKYYINEIQPYIAKLHQQSELIFMRVERLSNHLNSDQEMSLAFDGFWNGVYVSEDSEWQLFNAAIKQHTINWQQLLTQCGRMPS
jgi:hypothetical protein